MTIGPVERRGLHEVLALSVTAIMSGGLAIAEVIYTGRVSESLNAFFIGVCTSLVARTLKNARDRKGAAAAAAAKGLAKEGASDR